MCIFRPGDQETQPFTFLIEIQTKNRALDKLRNRPLEVHSKIGIENLCGRDSVRLIR